MSEEEEQQSKPAEQPQPRNGYTPGYPVSGLIEEPSEGMEESNVVPQP
jgi:hypothetical protein